MRCSPQPIPRLRHGMSWMRTTNGARLNCIAHLLSKVPYQEILREAVELPQRQDPEGYKEPKAKYKHVPAVY